MATPVKYAVVAMWLGYKVIDTSFSGNFKTVKRFFSLTSAHLCARQLNKAEGFEYGW